MASNAERDDVIDGIAAVLAEAAPIIAAKRASEQAENEAYGAYARACHAGNFGCMDFARWREVRANLAAVRRAS